MIRPERVWPRIVAHADMDAYYAAIEQLDDAADCANGPYYSDIGRPSVDPELMIRLLIAGYCCGIRSERRLTQEVELHLAYRWFCKLDLEDEIPRCLLISR
jgi:transposase